MQQLKGNINEQTCTVLMDFAENFVSTYGEEIQSAYFNKNSVTLHPLVVHYTNAGAENYDKELACRSYEAIVDSRSHSASTVFAILQQLMPMLKVYHTSVTCITLQIHQQVNTGMSPSPPCY